MGRCGRRFRSGGVYGGSAGNSAFVRGRADRGGRVFRAGAESRRTSFARPRVQRPAATRSFVAFGATGSTERLPFLSPSPNTATIVGVNFPRVLAAGLLVALFALTATACGGVQKPEGWASPVVDGSTIYYFPKRDHVASLAVDGINATQSWIFPDKARGDTKGLNFKASYDATLDGDNLYFGAWKGPLFALAAKDGALRWKLDHGGGGIVGGPVVNGDRVIFATSGGRLFVRDKATGRTAAGWPEKGLNVGSEVYAEPVVAGEVIVLGTLKGELLAFKLADGSRAWDAPFKASGAIPEVALLDSGRLFVPTLNKRVYIIDVTTGKALNGDGFKANDWVWSRPYFKDGVAYFGDFSGRVYALDITTSQVRWQAELGARIKAAPAAISDVLIVGTREPAVVFLSLADGKVLNTVPIDSGTLRAPLVVSGDRVLIASTKGNLYLANPADRGVDLIVVAGKQ